MTEPRAFSRARRHRGHADPLSRHDDTTLHRVRNEPEETSGAPVGKWVGVKKWRAWRSGRRGERLVFQRRGVRPGFVDGDGDVF